MENSQVSNDAAQDLKEPASATVDTQGLDDTQTLEDHDTDAATQTLVPADSSGDYVVPATVEQLLNQDIFPSRGMENVLAKKLLTVPGTIDVDSKLAGLGGRGFPRVVVQLDPVEKVAAVDAIVAVTWPSPVTDIAAACREVLKEAILAFTGYETTRANVVIGHAVPGRRVTAAEVANRPTIRARTPQVREAHVRQPVVTHKARIRNIALVDEPNVRAVELLAEPQVRTVATPTAPRVRNIDTPETAALRAITTRDGLDVTSVDILNAVEPREVKTAEQRRLLPVDTSPGTQVSHVPVPDAPELREVSYAEADVRSPAEVTPSPLRTVNEPEPTVINVDVPEPPQLREVTLDKPELRSVDAPRPKRLKEITLDKRATHSVDAPQPKPLREIHVNSTPLAEVTLRRSTPLKHVDVPQPTPLRYIDVSPANVTIRKKKG